MAISLGTTKLLWGRSASRCAICRSELSETAVDPEDDDTVVGEMAHIIARKEIFTRGDYDNLPPHERDRYSNLILLCRRHHKVIDDQRVNYTVDRLRIVKSEHETWVANSLGARDEAKDRDEQVYSMIIDTWCQRINIDNWSAVGSSIYMPEGPMIKQKLYETWNSLGSWIISRVWPRRYPTLEAAFFNFKNVHGAFLTVMDRHLDFSSPQAGWLSTDRFYKIAEWNVEKYNSLYKEFDSHICLAGNLFTELTRAANLVCHEVRKNIFHGFRVREGVLLIRRDLVDGFKTECFRAEYPPSLQDAFPFKGLETFEKSQFEGDYVLKPYHLKREE